MYSQSHISTHLLLRLSDKDINAMTELFSQTYCFKLQGGRKVSILFPLVGKMSVSIMLDPTHAPKVSMVVLSSLVIDRDHYEGLVNSLLI